jgi:hypothetical protein
VVHATKLASPPSRAGDSTSVELQTLRVARMGSDATTTVVLDALTRTGATIAPTPLPDVRDEAMDITRRYWAHRALTFVENAQLPRDWSRFQRCLLVATAELTSSSRQPQTARPRAGGNR